MKRMKKLAIIIAICSILALPSAAMATTFNNDVPSGLTLLDWIVGTNQNGKSTSINFYYSGGFNAPMIINVPFDSSWKTFDDVRPILLAEKNGYGNYFGGTNGSFGTNIKFSDDVLAAMKVQNFNPSEVGGANITPSSTTLNSDQITWLKQPGIGYASDLANITSATQPTTSTQTQVVTPTPSVPHEQTQSQPQVQPQTQQTSSTNQTSSISSTPVQSKSTTQAQVKSIPPAGEVIKTPSGQITQQMVATDQQLSKQNPPSLNPANIPTPVQNERKPLILNHESVVAGRIVCLILLVGICRLVYIIIKKIKSRKNA